MDQVAAETVSVDIGTVPSGVWYAGQYVTRPVSLFVTVNYTVTGATTQKYGRASGWQDIQSANNFVFTERPQLTNTRLKHGVASGNSYQVDITTTPQTFEIWEGANLLGSHTVTANIIGTVDVENGDTVDTLLLEDLVLNLNYNATTGDFTSDLQGPVVPPGPLDDWENRVLELPYLVPDGAETVTVEIGDQTIVFPVSPDDIEGGDFANLEVTIPANWDGMITIDGETIPLAPRVQYVNSPHMEYSANLYDSTLPPGVDSLVSEPLTLPPGVQETDSLSLPAGVSAVTIGQVTGGNLPLGVTKDDGSSSWAYKDLEDFNAPTPSTTSGGGDSASTSDQPPEAGESALVDSGSMNGFNSGGDPTLPSAGLEGVGDQWETIKGQIIGKFGSFAPLANQSIPTISSLTVPLSFGQLGNRTVNLDFTGEPFPAVRTLLLVIVIFHAGVSFIRFLRV